MTTFVSKTIDHNWVPNIALEKVATDLFYSDNMTYLLMVDYIFLIS